WGERIWVGYQEISGVSSCHTCIAPVVMKLRNHPTVGIDHWGHGSLAVGRPEVRLSSGGENWRSSTPEVGTKKQVLELVGGER
ncbi:hypothetical protein AVEN_120975-1, partial [Araneus ventricosus]